MKGVEEEHHQAVKSFACKNASPFMFGPHTIPSSQVFFVTTQCYALVNIKPVVKGHVMVVPRRVVPRFCDLSSLEMTDAWRLVRLIASRLENIFDASALTIAVQDGKMAGQSVPHTHIHILPRRKGDFKRNDDIYDALEERDEANEVVSVPKNGNIVNENLKNKEPSFVSSHCRSTEEMRIEATMLRTVYSSEIQKPSSRIDKISYTRSDEELQLIANSERILRLEEE